MSKNFEEEYRQMIDSELPDLWSRIEAQLPKTAAVMPEPIENGNIATPTPEPIENGNIATPTPEPIENGNIVTPTPETVRNGDAVTAGRRKLSRRQWMPVVIAAAAAILCVLAALPMLFAPRNTNTARPNMTDDKMSGVGGADGGAMATAEDADISYEMADEAKGNDSSEDLSVPELAAGSQSAGSDNMAPMAEPENPAYDTDDVYGSNALQNGEEAAVREDTPDYVQMEVRILDSITSGDGEVFYEAAVLQNDGNISEKGIRIYFRRAREGEEQNDYADASFRRGESYLLYLYRSNETLASYGIEDRIEDRNEGGEETEDKGEELYSLDVYIVYDAALK